MILDDRPHRLQYLVTTEGYEDENGDYHPGESYFDGNIECRAVPSSGKADEKQFEDGVVRRYSYTVYMDVDCKEFNIGDRVGFVLEGIEKVYEVKGFHRYQLYAKLWV